MAKKNIVLPPEESARIEMLRFLLILLIVFVHVPFGDAESPYRANAGIAEFAVVMVRDGFGRLGVPLLTVISGWLLMAGGKRYGAVIRGKVRTLVMPFLAFNLPVFVSVTLLQSIGMGTFWPPIVDQDLAVWLNQAFAITDRPTNQSLYFLRDLMLCVTISPLLIHGLRRWPIAVLAATVGYAVMPDRPPIFIKDTILPAFALGVYVHISGKRLDQFIPGRMWAALPLVGAAIGLAALSWFEPAPLISGPSGGFLMNLSRLVLLAGGCAACWSLSIAVMHSGVAANLGRFGKYSFLVFLTHQPLSVLLFMIAYRIDLPYPVFYFAVPAICVGLAIAAQTFLTRWTPWSFAMATGGRQLRAA